MNACVTYKQFGAVGDGVADDFRAIRAAHAYANENKLPVKIEGEDTYVIRETLENDEVAYISIKTDTEWGKTRFIIDDTALNPLAGDKTYTKDIFYVENDEPKTVIEDPVILERLVSEGLAVGTEKINLGFGEPVMIVPYNKLHNVYRRKGYGGFAGTPMHEVILLDAEGRVNPETPVMFDYKHIDYINVYPLNVKPIVVSGGVFTTKASRANMTVKNPETGDVVVHDRYFARGIEVMRHFTRVVGVQHYIEGEFTIDEQLKEGKTGVAYNGFFGASFASEVTFEGCVLTGHRCFNKASVGYKGGTLGTYDFRANCVNKIVLKGCVQSNFFITIDENNIIHPAEENTPDVHLSMISIPGTWYQLHWGVGCTDFCKNMQYLDSTLARFDAHMGLYNGKISNSTVNYIAITGGGEMIIENTRWFAAKPDYNANSMIHLRSDYGSIWNGTVKVKNCKAYIFTKDYEGNPTETWIAMHSYTNWYYGYKCAFPSIEIDGLEYYSIETKEPLPKGYEIKLCAGSIKGEPAMHLETTVYNSPWFADIDADGDGFVDGTKIPFDDVVERNGIEDISSHVNLNVITPPRFFKVFNNKNGYKYTVYRTDSDPCVPDGGFLGKTEFATDSGVYVGTNHENVDTGAIVFEKY
jgi:hypothetical protein